MTERKLGDRGQCEAVDWVQTDDDAVSVRCHESGRRIEEHDVINNTKRWRIVCAKHGLADYLDIS